MGCPCQRALNNGLKDLCPKRVVSFGRRNIQRVSKSFKRIQSYVQPKFKAVSYRYLISIRTSESQNIKIPCLKEVFKFRRVLQKQR
jgi:hypothetical protein